jgi:hypothetical protein
MGQPRALFDRQADTYDQRVGLPEQDCQAIARTVLTLANTQRHDLLIEIGAGTGTIGTWFARQPLRYVGLDVSRRMLAAFRHRLSGHSSTLLLLHADGNAPWPLTQPGTRRGGERTGRTARWRGHYYGPSATPGRQRGRCDAAGDAAFTASPWLGWTCRRAVSAPAPGRLWPAGRHSTRPGDSGAVGSHMDAMAVNRRLVHEAWTGGA